MKSITLVSLLCVVCVFSENFENCRGTQNLNPPINMELILNSSVPHGKRYTIPYLNTSISMAVVNGTPYECGYAIGQLFKTEINANLENMAAFIAEDARQLIEKYLPDYLQFLKDLPVETILQMALEDELAATAPYTPLRYEQEITGMAEGAGIDAGLLRRINLFPELIRASCSIVGAWGPATLTGGLLHLRALDWNSDSPMSEYPLITIYHIQENGSQPFANFGWAGMIGSLAGFSSKVGIGEKYWWPGQKNITTMYGQPWMYVLRDVLQFGTDLESALGIMETAKRTWKIYVGLGALADNELRGIEYAAKSFVIYDDLNYTTPYPIQHPTMKGVFYLDKDIQPSDNPCLGSTLEVGYGNMTASYLFQTSAALEQTGDTLLAVYDYQAQQVYLAFADYASATPAYVRPMVVLNMTQLFSIQV